MENEQKTDLDLANDALAALKPNVTASDRKEAPVAESTLIQYLNGSGKDLDTAMELLQYFRGRIEERRKLLVSQDQK
jgi:hypothetical protein